LTMRVESRLAQAEQQSRGLPRTGRRRPPHSPPAE
jgi:hypothetical protein